MWVYRQPAFPQRPFYRRSGHRQTNFKKITSHELLYCISLQRQKRSQSPVAGLRGVRRRGAWAGSATGQGQES